ncbi:ABC transporter permease subunit [Actinoplanes aureus]|uniref:ABC transporter permease subunit n=1 Tax=Actinoplanes aureus TaxID=2792083 RepID=A0A931CC32_9ACTN|nr:ABC transporter permease subunit [Actinoplanes aureus]MBG0564697.1 ABC transporter permease subunit [Actinoplanes aureus]
MIWMTWRQFRNPALVTGALLLVLLAGLALTWAQVTDLAAQAGFTGCQGDACAGAAETFLDSLRPRMAYELHLAAIVTLILLPVLLGIFWGAPLVARELETGTYRMVFSQSVGRGRWLLVKLLIGGAAAALGAGLLSLMLTRWAQPIDAASADRLNPLVFGARGIVPVGYAALAFVAGVTAGLLLRRTLTAMVVTLLVVAGLQLAGPLVVRPWLADPATTTVPLDVDGQLGISMSMDTKEIRVHVEPDLRGAWVLSNTTVTSTGAEFTGPADTTQCGPEAPRDRETCPGWLKAQNLSQELTYVPGSRFWALQWREFGVLIALTLGLSWFSLWWIRRRLT